MDRLACVDVPALPLQLLLRAHPAWAESPVAVVENDKPQGAILWVNKRARRAGIEAGMRAGTARSLAPELCAGVISPRELELARDELVAHCRNFSARVEPSPESDGEPGVLWLDASGLLQLFTSLDSWAQLLRKALADAQLRAAVAVGFRRFATSSVARSLRAARCVVFANPEEEAAAAGRVLLSRAGLPERTLEALEQLGVRTIAEFLRLPAAGILRRFGPEAHRLRRLAAGELAAPMQPLAPEEPLLFAIELDDAEIDRTRLTFLAKQLLDSLLARLAEEGNAAALLVLRLTLRPEKSPPQKRSIAPDGVALARADAVREAFPKAQSPNSKAPEPSPLELREELRPTAATLDAAQLLGLLRLRLESLPLPRGVIRLALSAEPVRATREQLEMHKEKPRRDLAAAARAFARLRALFGEKAVVRARLEPGHLPEARFSWEPLAQLLPAAPRTVSSRPLVRRVKEKAAVLPPRESREPDGWLICGLSGGRVVHLDGPHRLSGGWWQSELERDYYFAETSLGELLWVFYDRRRRRWLLQGAVS